MKIAFFGSSLVSSYWNGAATYYRGIVRALHGRGYDVTFYEPDAYDRQRHRDIPDPAWVRVVVYDPDRWSDALDDAAGSDVAVKASGVGVRDAELEAGVFELGAATAIFWDVDAPATLARLEHDTDDPLATLIPKYDLVLTYGGGQPVVERYERIGARACIPIYNALDPTTHFPVPPDSRFAADLSLLANRLPDREARIDEFFVDTAARVPRHSFLLGGAGWEDKQLPPNVCVLGHVSTREHNAFNCTPLAVLNVTRDSMAANGWSPPTRVFEAAGAGACLITDEWDGIETFLEPGEEVLVAASGEEVAELVDELGPERAREIGAAARARVLREHTYDQRVQELEEALGVAV